MQPTINKSGQNQFSAISLFAGCGGSDLGLRHAGIETIWANEVNESAAELYGHVTGTDVMEHADIRSVDKFKHADILAGCYPCTGYSQAGRRKSDDSINYLYREFDRALRQIKPLAFIVENVDGMRFAQNEPLYTAQLVRFRSAGYSVVPGILNASDYGVPQERRRLFLVGIQSKEKLRFAFPPPTHGDGCDQAHLSQRDSIWHLRKEVDGTYCDEPLHWYYLSRNRRRTWSKPAACIVAHWRHVGLHPDSPPLRKVGPDKWEFTRDPHKARRLSYLECAALQGFPNPNAFMSASIRQRFRAIGNAVPPPLFAVVASALVDQLRFRPKSGAVS